MSSKFVAGSMALLFSAVAVNIGLNWLDARKLSSEILSLRSDLVGMDAREGQFERESNARIGEVRQMLADANSTLNTVQSMVTELQKSLALIGPLLERLKSGADAESAEASNGLVFSDQIKVVEVEIGSKVLPKFVDYLEQTTETMTAELRSVLSSPMSYQMDLIFPHNQQEWDADALIKKVGEEYKVELSPERDALVRAKVHEFNAIVSILFRKYKALQEEETEKRLASGDFDPIVNGKRLSRKYDRRGKIFSSGSSDTAVIDWDQDAHPEVYHAQILIPYACLELIKEINQEYQKELASK